MRGEYVIDPTGRTPLSFRSMEALMAAHGPAFIDGDTEITYMCGVDELDPHLTLIEPPPGLRVEVAREPTPIPIERTPYGPNRKTRRMRAALARRRGAGDVGVGIESASCFVKRLIALKKEEGSRH